MTKDDTTRRSSAPREHAKRENRSAPRVQTSSDHRVLYVAGSGSIRDLSLTGVFVVDENPMPVGTIINFELRLPSCSIPVRGVVRRSIPGEGLAIQFTQLSVEGKILLKSYLNTESRSLKGKR